MRDDTEAAKGAAPLVTVLRGSQVDTVHLGVACIVDAAGKIRFSLGDASYRAFFRSSSKPLQALPLLIDGVADAYGFDHRDLAVICGSHGGSSAAIQQVSQVMKKSGVPVDALGCGDGLADQCSGKHAGMLAACRFHGYSLKDYLRPDHPWQRRIHSVLSDYCGLPKEKINLAEDGCSAVTFELPLYNMALAFARLARESRRSGGEANGELSNPVARMLLSMSEGWGDLTGEPDLRWIKVRRESDKTEYRDPFTAEHSGSPATRVGGNYPSLVTKGGAGGLLCAALPELGLGVALKIIDGSPIPRWPAFSELLLRTNLIEPVTAQAMHALWPKVLTRKGKEVGSFRMEF